MMGKNRLGATVLDGGRCRFEVWAPLAGSVEVILVGAQERRCEMDRRAAGYFTTVLDEVPAGTRYLYRLQQADSTVLERPDPASRHQPDGVHEPSAVVAADFDWQDRGWHGLPLDRYIIYELHVGTFSRQGTFAGIARHLDEIADLGITAIELMPIAQFPGRRNWGYDGVYPFASQNSYGGPQGLKVLVNACHRRGLAVVLDVVYNHIGPEGNYLRDFGHYFTDFYHTPWGEAINFDGAHSDHVRRYFTENALQWLDEFHIDALRLDAVHAIMDFSARPFLEELSRAVHRRAREVNRRLYLIAESALNDTRVIRSRAVGGFALDAQWNDDFHHSLRTALTDERPGYYRDYNGLEDLAKAWREGYVYSGGYSAFRQRAFGNSSRNVPARQLVVFAQNHDQVGNRMLGERLSGLVSFEKQKLAAGLVLLSPFVPLIFMGEEYGETAPFLYFVSHGDPGLVQAVREGRRREFEAFGWQAEPPDPQAEETFNKSILNRALLQQDRHRTLRDFYRELLGLRARTPALANLSKKNMTVTCDRRQNLLLVRRWLAADQALLIFNFDDRPQTVTIDLPPGRWCRRVDSADPRWRGPGSDTAAELQAAGPMAVRVAATCVVVLTRNEGEG
ncbi:MAG: malto-oligosyltrehalose trehalohydrolase [Desulfobacterales bacterium]